MADRFAPNTRPGLHELRHEQERLSYAVESLIRVVLPGIALSNMVEYRKRVLASGITMPQAMQLHKDVLSLVDEDKDRLAGLHAAGAPIETVINYLSAPRTRAGTSVPVREEIYNQIMDNHAKASRPMAQGGLSRPLYIGAFLAASTSVAFLGTRLAGLSEQTSWAVRPLTKIFDQLEGFLPTLAAALGQDAASLMSSATPGGASLLLGAGIMATVFQRSAARARRVSLSGQLEEPVSGVAQAMYGQNKTALVLSRYARLSEGHKHLLSHLSPHELRVVLAGGPQAAREVLASRPVSYQQQVHAMAHDSRHGVDFLAKMMEVSLPDVVKEPVRVVLAKLSLAPEDLRPEDRVVAAVYPPLSQVDQPVIGPVRPAYSP